MWRKTNLDDLQTISLHLLMAASFPEKPNDASNSCLSDNCTGAGKQ